jgi:hypothetical protein
MLLKIDQICRENIKVCHGTEYILIDNFFDSHLFDTAHKTYLLDYFVIDDTLQGHMSLSGHPLREVLLKYESEMLNAINLVWQENCIENKFSVNLLPAGNKLPIHNDTHWIHVPIRGVLYLNDSCGTTFHSDVYGNEPVDIGGKPNQLLLFKINDNSHHSVGLLDHTVIDRFTISMMFDRTKEENK